MSATTDTTSDAMIKRQAYRDLHILRDNGRMMYLPHMAQPVYVVGDNGSCTAEPEKFVEGFLSVDVRFSLGLAPDVSIDFVNHINTIVDAVLHGYKLRVYPLPDDLEKFFVTVVEDMRADLAAARHKYVVYECLGFFRFPKANSLKTVEITGSIGRTHVCFSREKIPKKIRVAADDIRAYYLIGKIDEHLTHAWMRKIKDLTYAIVAAARGEIPHPPEDLSIITISAWEKRLSNYLMTLIRPRTVITGGTQLDAIKIHAYRKLHILRDNDLKIYLPGIPEDLITLDVLPSRSPSKTCVAEIVDYALDLHRATFVEFADNVATILEHVLNGYTLRDYPLPDDMNEFMRQVVNDMNSDFALAKRKCEIYQRLAILKTCDVKYHIKTIGYNDNPSTVGQTIYWTISLGFFIRDWDQLDDRAYITAKTVDQKLGNPPMKAIKTVVDAIVDMSHIDFPLLSEPATNITVAEWANRLSGVLNNLESFKVPSCASVPTPADLTLPLAKANTYRPNLFFQKGDIDAIYLVTDPEAHFMVPEMNRDGLWRLAHPKSGQRLKVDVFISAEHGETNPWVRMAVDFVRDHNPDKMYVFTSRNDHHTGAAATLYRKMLDKPE